MNMIKNYINEKINLIKNSDIKAKYKIKKIIKEFYINILRLVFIFRKKKGLKVVEKDWDYLIILDACRFDYFNTEYKKYLKGKLSLAKSRGSCTKEWLKNNFEEYQNKTVVVSANPYYSENILKGIFGFNPFFYIKNVWKNEWNKKLNTVKPEKITKVVLNLKKKFPNKKFIIHYMQPHHPFINSNIHTEGFNLKDALEGGGKSGKTVWKMLEDGEISVDRVKKAYIENLRLVLREVNKLIKKLDGSIVITSDHGNCFGEHGLFSHYYGIYFKELINVPYLEVKK